MATAATTVFGPASNGILMSPEEFDGAEFEDGWRYEQIHGLLIVTEFPSEAERDANDELGYWLRRHQDEHPAGSAIDVTLHEHTVVTPASRRRADRVIWTGLGRLPRRNETLTIVIEFVAEGRANFYRDYEEKRDEYLAVGIREYWIIDRFDSTMSVFTLAGTSFKQRVLRRTQTFKTPLLPGFALPLGQLLTFTQRWADDPPASLD